MGPLPAEQTKFAEAATLLKAGTVTWPYVLWEDLRGMLRIQDF